MRVPCDKCSGPTTEKRIPYKDKSKGVFIKYECQSGCMNGKWRYTCFAPKDGPRIPYKEPVKDNQILEELQRQTQLLNNILGRLKGAKDMYTGEDLQPDENVPF